ncbi:hypothetical protein PRUPE_6G000200 [Prunus persica]|uniref:Uncharacterized protein n=1 Tax=Prunus persica TaxID=3760 RepID=A0A251NHY1_PRUPE|nr:hypothetical protein PRUPE_6G000200 [Prunus persica]
MGCLAHTTKYNNFHTTLNKDPLSGQNNPIFWTKSIAQYPIILYDRKRFNLNNIQKIIQMLVQL